LRVVGDVDRQARERRTELRGRIAAPERAVGDAVTLDCLTPSRAGTPYIQRAFSGNGGRDLAAAAKRLPPDVRG
jgi:hypothetical protein